MNRPTRSIPLLGLLAVLSAAPGPTQRAEPVVIVPNPNTQPAGTLRGGVLTLELEVLAARWHDRGGVEPGSAALAFAEVGGTPTIPGPLIRVPAGTEVRVKVRNSLPRVITFFLPVSATTSDSVIVDAGASGEIAVRMATPGNFIYRATDSTRWSRRLGIVGALAGAVVVDSAGAIGEPRDRVMMIMMTPDSANVTRHQADTTMPTFAGRFAFTINGLSWPRTQRLSATVGDTLRWRVINGSGDIHPMHLHGFYFRVETFTGPLVARDGQGAPDRMVVTERMTAFSAMSMSWVPEEPGNWVFHCHFSVHLVPPTVGADLSMKATDHENHALTGMVGLVVGITVAPKAGTAATATAGPARRIRLIAVSDSGFPPDRPSQRFIIEENGTRREAHPGFSPTLHLTRRQPVAITVVNRLTEHTAVHWHGLELESYYDGVAGLSGAGNRLAPTIAPGDSFEVRMSPPRSGTFMYHAHVDDMRQQRAGLTGALIVRDGPATTPPDEVEVFLKAAQNAGPLSGRLELGGRANPDTVVLRAGRTTRFRLMSLSLFQPNAGVVITARPDSVFPAPRDTMLVQWTPVAKDGADLPPAARTPRAARQIIGMGETYDFEFTPASAGQQLRLEVRAAGGTGNLLARIPLRVDPPRP